MTERSVDKPVISMQEAVRSIVDTRRTGRPITNPFAFLVGAGISVSSVPLAKTITERCEAKARSSGIESEPESSSPIDQYSYWFEKAYPHTSARQQYLQELIEGRPIPFANFRLAHLLIEGFTNLVITPNFDDFLTRALRTFGYNKFRVCDHPDAAARIIPELAETQIIHVHGTYRFYDAVNLKDEVKVRAKKMRDLLDHIFRLRVPIVVGYSGWEKDVIMTALRHRLATKAPLAYKLYWFCHRPEILPDWLTADSNVCVVVPEENQSLAAEQVFDELIRVWGCKVPRLVRSPVEFFADQLEESLPKGEEQPDPYSLRRVVARIRRAAQLEESEFEKAEFEATDRNMEDVRNAVRRVDYVQASNALTKIPLQKLSIAQFVELKNLSEIVEKSLPKGAASETVSQMRERADQMQRRKEAGEYEDDMYTDELERRNTGRW